MLKRFFLFLLIISTVLGLFLFSLQASAQTESLKSPDAESKKIDYILFHLYTCPHCRDEIEFLNKEIMPKYGEFINLKMYEVSSAENQQIFEQYGSYYQVPVGSVPVAFIDGEVVYGYSTDQTTGKQILQLIEKKLAERGIAVNGSGEKKENEQCDSGCVNVPVLGRIDPQNFSLPVLTVSLGLLDGFNPCAMWVLLFLITLLLGMKNKRRMWLLGSIFIFASGAVYFIFMAAWLQLILFIGLIGVIRLIIGLLAVTVGGLHLRDFWKNRKADGVVCKVSGNENNRKIFDKIKNIVHRQSLIWSIIGIIILGFSVNLVELACSAGFPAIFTQVLAISDLAAWQRYGYMAGYIFFYMLDDMIVFILAMVTLKATGFGGKYAKYVNAFSGLLILILGLLLIFKPEWLMFG
ncbi:MAG: hypothetical protein WC862_01565 [Patescibacteria group bacterium]